jgi:hypothetical protein
MTNMFPKDSKFYTRAVEVSSILVYYIVLLGRLVLDVSKNRKVNAIPVPNWIGPDDSRSSGFQDYA